MAKPRSSLSKSSKRKHVKPVKRNIRKELDLKIEESDSWGKMDKIIV
jgi:hypothetical protein